MSEILVIKTTDVDVALEPVRLCVRFAMSHRLSKKARELIDLIAEKLNEMRVETYSVDSRYLEFCKKVENDEALRRILG